MHKRTCTLSLAMILATLPLAYAAPTPSEDIVILYTNDMHCAIDQRMEDDVPYALGFAGIAGYEAQLQAGLTYPITLVDIGDAIQGESAGTLSDGQAVIDLMNAVGYDIAIPGNHEFDYGMETFLSYATEGLDCGYISANFLQLATGEPVLEPYRMLTFGDTQVAFVGICTPETLVKSTPTYFQDADHNYLYDFAQGQDGQALYTLVQDTIDDVTAQGADYVIALGHCGTDAESSPWTSPEIIANVSGLDAFLDGHSHSEIAMQTVTDLAGEPVLLSSTGTKLANLGVLTLGADGTITTALQPASALTAQDPTIAQLVADVHAENAVLLDQVVATSAVDLTILDEAGENKIVYYQETNMGNLCADAYRVMGEADIGWTNGGGVRADIHKGDVTYADILAVHPFGNTLCVVEATGQEILDALEYTAAEQDGVLQVSGITYAVNTALPSTVVKADDGSFASVAGDYRVTDVMVGDAPLDLQATYTLASHNYMLKNGGGGINMFMDNVLLKNDLMMDDQMLIDYITDSLGGEIGQDYATAQQRAILVNRPVTEPEPQPEPQPEPEPVEYIVVQGDTLSKIAAAQLGDYTRWIDIYHCNQDTMVSKDIMHPGDVLVLPAA